MCIALRLKATVTEEQTSAVFWIAIRIMVTNSHMGKRVWHLIRSVYLPNFYDMICYMSACVLNISNWVIKFNYTKCKMWWQGTWNRALLSGINEDYSWATSGVWITRFNRVHHSIRSSTWHEFSLLRNHPYWWHSGDGKPNQCAVDDLYWSRATWAGGRSQWSTTCHGEKRDVSCRRRWTGPNVHVAVKEQVKQMWTLQNVGLQCSAKEQQQHTEVTRHQCPVNQYKKGAPKRALQVELVNHWLRYRCGVCDQLGLKKVVSNLQRGRINFLETAFPEENVNPLALCHTCKAHFWLISYTNCFQIRDSRTSRYYRPSAAEPRRRTPSVFSKMIQGSSTDTVRLEIANVTLEEVASVAVDIDLMFNTLLILLHDDYAIDHLKISLHSG